MVNLIQRKGQSTLEYVIILTALVVAFIVGTVAVKKALIGEDKKSGLIGQAANTIPEFTQKLPGVPER